MKVKDLKPVPTQQCPFTWPYKVTVPEQSGCYVLAAHNDEVLYVGLATASIRARMAAHLDTPEKRTPGPHGIPTQFYFIFCDVKDVSIIERGWLNQSILEDGVLPLLNRVHSPS